MTYRMLKYSVFFFFAAGALKALSFQEENRLSLSRLSLKIEKHINLLKEVHDLYQESYPQYDARQSTMNSFIRPQFEHELILWCAKKIGVSNSLEPLFEIWDEFQQYQGIDLADDELFMRECCHLIFIIYNNILCSLDSDCLYWHQKRRVQWEEIRDLYVQVASLPLAKFVSLLDKIVVGLTESINKYSHSGGGILGWVKQNWWIPPTVLAGVITALLIG